MSSLIPRTPYPVASSSRGQETNAPVAKRPDLRSDHCSVRSLRMRNLRPALSDDDREAASAVLNRVVECTLTLNEQLGDLANAHFDTSPASSLHVLRLNRAIARAVMEWIEQWPS
jgi:hypothetical protein